MTVTGDAPPTEEGPSRKGPLHPTGWPACLAVVLLCVLLKPLSTGYLTLSGLILVDALILAFHIISYQRYRNNRGRDAALYIAHATLVLFFFFQVDMGDLTYSSPAIALPAYLFGVTREAVTQFLESAGLGLRAFLVVEFTCLAALVGSWVWMARPNTRQ